MASENLSRNSPLPTFRCRTCGTTIEQREQPETTCGGCGAVDWRGIRI